MARRPATVRDAIKVQKRSGAVVLAALQDEEFMKGVLDSQRREAAGEKGEPWPQVKARLGIV